MRVFARKDGRVWLEVAGHDQAIVRTESGEVSLSEGELRWLSMVAASGALSLMRTLDEPQESEGGEAA